MGTKTVTLLRNAIIWLIFPIFENVSCYNFLDNIQWEREIANYIKNNPNITLPRDYVISEAEAYAKRREFDLGMQNEDRHLNISQLISKYGYTVEEHTLVTTDGYILTLFRIPGEGQTIFLMHGFTASSDDWVTPGVSSGLAYLLAEQGYDVWMGNARGNKHSRNNIHLRTEQKKFWEFSWHEIGTIDVPAMIDYVLEKTSRDKLVYIGHSQGTTTFFVMCSERPEYNDKVSLMIALSAVAWMSHLTSPGLRVLVPFTEPILALGEVAHIYEMLPDNKLTQIFRSAICGNQLLAFTVCQNYIFLISGFDYDQVNFKQLPVIFAHNPAGASVYQSAHYSQLISSGTFRRYDNGIVNNFRIYGSITPPSYDVTKITTKVAIMHSDNDWLSNIKDVNILISKLPNLVDFYRVPSKYFNHYDYIWAKDSKTLLLPKILELIQSYV